MAREKMEREWENKKKKVESKNKKCVYIWKWYEWKTVKIRVKSDK